jgi:hypothetical protein
MDDREFVKYTFLIVAAVAVVGLLTSGVGDSVTGMLSLEKFSGMEAKKNCGKLTNYVKLACRDAKSTGCSNAKSRLKSAGCSALALPKEGTVSRGAVKRSAKIRAIPGKNVWKSRKEPVVKQPSSYTRPAPTRNPVKMIGGEKTKELRADFVKKGNYKPTPKKAVLNQVAVKPARKYTAKTCASVFKLSHASCDKDKASFKANNCEKVIKKYATYCGGVEGAPSAEDLKKAGGLTSTATSGSSGSSTTTSGSAADEPSLTGPLAGTSGSSGSATEQPTTAPESEHTVEPEQEEAALESELEAEDVNLGVNVSANTSVNASNATGITGAVTAVGEGSGDFSTALFAVLIGVVGLFLYYTRNEQR